MRFADSFESACGEDSIGVDEGFVSLMSYDYWTLDQDPMIDSLRDDPRFEVMKLELDQRIEMMREERLACTVFGKA